MYTGEVDAHPASFERHQHDVRGVVLVGLKLANGAIAVRRRARARQSARLETSLAHRHLHDVQELYELTEHHCLGLTLAGGARGEVHLEALDERLYLGARLGRSERVVLVLLPLGLVRGRLDEIAHLALLAAQRARGFALERRDDARLAEDVRASRHHGGVHRREADAAVVQTAGAKHAEETLERLRGGGRARRLRVRVFGVLWEETVVAAQLAESKDHLQRVRVVVKDGAVLNHPSQLLLRAREHAHVPRAIFQAQVHGLNHHTTLRKAHERLPTRRALVLGASQRHGGHDGDETIESSRIAALHRSLHRSHPKRLVVQRFEANEAEQTLQIRQAVLNGRAGDGPSPRGVERERRLRLVRLRVLDVVRLVQYHAKPLELRQRTERPLRRERTVGGDDHVRLLERRGKQVTIRAVVSHHRERPVGVLGDLLLPVGQHRKRAHHQRCARTTGVRRRRRFPNLILRAFDALERLLPRRRLPLPRLLRGGRVDVPRRSVRRWGARAICRDQRHHLQRLPQPHVVRQDSAAAHVRPRLTLERADEVFVRVPLVRPKRRERVGVLARDEPCERLLLMRVERRGDDRGGFEGASFALLRLEAGE